MAEAIQTRSREGPPQLGPADGPRVDVLILGAARHYAVPTLLSRAGLLGRLFTDSYVGNKPWLELGLRLVPRALRPRPIESWLGRSAEGIPRERVRSFELFGIRYWLAQQRARGAGELVEVFAAYAERFNRLVLRREPPNGDVLYALGNACLEVVEWARQKGMKIVVEQMDLPRPLKRDILVEEAKRWPGWAPDLVDLPCEDGLSRREQKEWPLADCVLAPSRFTAECLVRVGVEETKVRVIPYGVDLSKFPNERRRGEPGAKIHILYAGEVDLRKGVPYLLCALRLLGSAGFETRIAGCIRASAEKIAGFADVATFLGVVPRSEMAELYQWAHVFVFPTLGEGLALVQLEALASGVPVIATHEAGEAVRHEIDGFVIRSRSSEAIAEALERYAIDRPLLREHQDSTRNARYRVSLERYGEDLIRVLEDL